MAAGGTSANISLGAGRLYVAPVGTAEPTSASASLPSAWRALGYTEEGTKITIDLTNEPIEVAEEYDPILYIMTKRTVQVEAMLAEMTRRNLALVLQGTANATNDSSAFEPPDPGQEVAFMLIWDSNESPTSTNNSRWVFRQCKISGSVEISRAKAPAKATLPLTINVEKPSGQAPFKTWPNAAALV